MKDIVKNTAFSTSTSNPFNKQIKKASNSLPHDFKKSLNLFQEFLQIILPTKLVN